MQQDVSARSGVLDFRYLDELERLASLSWQPTPHDVIPTTETQSVSWSSARPDVVMPDGDSWFPVVIFLRRRTAAR